MASPTSVRPSQSGYAPTAPRRARAPCWRARRSSRTTWYARFFAPSTKRLRQHRLSLWDGAVCGKWPWSARWPGLGEALRQHILVWKRPYDMPSSTCTSTLFMRSQRATPAPRLGRREATGSADGRSEDRPTNGQNALR
eukprot:scaffold83021_cov71-Phaeocystis_antarctica.AAC.2